PSPRRLRIGVVVGRADGATLHPDVRAAVDRAADQCAALGHDVDHLEVPFDASVGDDFVLYWGMLAQAILLQSRQVLGSAYDVEGFDRWTRGLAAHAPRSASRVENARRIPADPTASPGAPRDRGPRPLPQRSEPSSGRGSALAIA
ncbi:MAG: hypothetical protein CMN30_18350, partial [Sandaracinus sp.]|nr:hypothetical protein [Sandaracinus sp.]